MKKPTSIFISSVLAAALWCFAADGSALTLGRSHAVAVLGSPLELNVSVRFEPEEFSDGLCFEAEVFYGEVRKSGNGVTVSTQISEQQNAGNVRVLALASIDEPVVTVVLRGGCAQKIARKYVLFADLVTQAELPEASSEVRSNPASRSEVGQVATREGVPTVASPQVGPRSPGVYQAVAPVILKPRPLVRTPLERTSRLKLVPLDTKANSDPVLRFSDRLSSVPVEASAQRVAAAAQWRSLNFTAENVRRDDERMASLEADLKAHRDISARTGRTLSELAVRLEEVEAQRYANPLVYGLVALVVACLAALVYAWQRLGASPIGASSWRGDRGDPEHAGAMREIPASGAVAGSSAPGAVPEKAPERNEIASRPLAVGLSEVDIDLDLEGAFFTDVDKTRPGNSGVQTAASVQSERSGQSPAPRDFSHSVADGLRAMNMKEMLDVRQQAEFFMTLGQYEEAIAMLEGSIRESGESNPMVYLDLIKAFHTLGRRPEYEHYREDFNRRFSGRVPDYMDFSNGGRDLEAYPEAIERLTPLWNSKEGMDFIEHCLVRSSGTASAQSFDLNAYRDMLMLHGVQSVILTAAESSPAPFYTTKLDFPEVLPEVPSALTQAIDPGSAQSIDELPNLSDAASEFIVDLDLSGDSNLMEFDAKGLSGNPPGPTGKS